MLRVRALVVFLLPSFMLAFPTMFFAYQFVVRIMPSLLAGQIMQQLNIGASLFGLLSVAYYLGYVLGNVPVAVLMEKYPPRVIIALASVLCGLFLFAFHYATNIYTALVLRFFIGITSGVGFIGISKVALQWFSKENYGMALSSSVTIGLFGAVFAGGPLNSLMSYYGTDIVLFFTVLSSLIVGVSVFMFLCSPERKTDEVVPPIKLADFKYVLFSLEVLLLGFGSLLMMGFDVGFSDLWGVSYLITAFSITKNEAASVISWGFFGVLVGAPILTFLGKILGEARVVVSSAVLTALIFYVVILSRDNFDRYVFIVSMFILGTLSSAKILTFAMCAKIVPAREASVALSLLNCIFMSGGIFHHAVIGVLLDCFWSGEMRGIQRYYGPDDFYWALLVVPVGCLLGGIMILLVNRMAFAKNLYSVNS